MVKLVTFDDPDATEQDIETYLLVVTIAAKHGVDPSSSIECETFFRQLLAEYTGDLDLFASWLDNEIPRLFPAITLRPRWIQAPAWPFANGKPMTFAGQIDISKEQGEVVSHIYHDDTSLYVFIAKNVSPVVVVQQF